MNTQTAGKDQEGSGATCTVSAWLVDLQRPVRSRQPTARAKFELHAAVNVTIDFLLSMLKPLHWQYPKRRALQSTCPLSRAEDGLGIDRLEWREAQLPTFQTQPNCRSRLAPHKQFRARRSQFRGTKVRQPTRTRPQMSGMEHLVEWELAGKIEVTRGDLPKRHFMRHDSMTWPGIEPGSRQWEAGD
jgi:hypothetical protein